MKQSITGNKMFMKRTILPITKKIGVKRVKVKIIPAQLRTDKDKIEISFDLDKKQNAELLDLLKQKVGKKRSMKRKKLNISVFKEKKSIKEDDFRAWKKADRDWKKEQRKIEQIVKKFFSKHDIDVDDRDIFHKLGELQDDMGDVLTRWSDGL